MAVGHAVVPPATAYGAAVVALAQWELVRKYRRLKQKRCSQI